MAHFAKLEDNKVVQVIVVNNQELFDENGQELEQKGIDFCSNLLGGTWIQTSYNGKIRKNYAGVDYTYDKTLDAFIPPKSFDSWILDTDKAQWKAPIDMPTDNKKYSWDETTTSWIEVTE
jgi:hypothetical protein